MITWPFVVLVLGVLYFILGMTALLWVMRIWKQCGQDFNETRKRFEAQQARVEEIIRRHDMRI